MERTLVFVKPDGVVMGNTGDCIMRIEKTGLQIIGLKMFHMSKEMAEEHYQEHKDQEFFPRVIKFVTMGPIIAFVVKGPKAVSVVRKIVGKTSPFDADPGTIRGDNGHINAEDAVKMDMPVMNTIHASGSPEEAEEEIKRMFSDKELCSYPNKQDILRMFYRNMI